ncbi:MAG: PQQ-binding-like beta-propeller repeat protein [Spirochaetota bacterium]
MSEKGTSENRGDTTQQTGLRLLPGIIIVVIQLLLRFVLPVIEPDGLMIAMFSGMLGGPALIVWWCFFSRARAFERWLAPVLAIVSLVAVSFFLDISIATANMGMMFMMFATPAMSLAFVLWAVIGSRLSALPRRTAMVISILLASAPWLFLRTDGMDGSANQSFNWRWAPTLESRLLAKGDEATVPAEAGTKAAWPGFRGENRDSIVRGISIATNWKSSPPKQLWRRSIGPGCSSMAVSGNMLFTQEQLGEHEAVSCYDITSGRPVWKHRDKARFYDSHAGAGPRATPTIAGRRVYTLGATGIVNALDMKTGSVIWTRNASTDGSVKNLNWGFAASPLVIGDIVIVSVSGKLSAYDAANGIVRWSLPDGGNSYSSPHLLAINGVPQIVHVSMAGAQSVAPETGKQLWNYAWKLEDRILQPALIAPNDLMLSSDGEQSVRRVHVALNSGKWSVTDVWSSTEMKLNFNDFVVHKGYAYGFHGPSIACIDIRNGKRVWKGERYRGWIVLLADEDMMLVLSEKGALALVAAKPDAFTELASISVLKGKTWNHPALAGDVLVVRNASEMAAYRLPLLGK